MIQNGFIQSLDFTERGLEYFLAGLGDVSPLLDLEVEELQALDLAGSLAQILHRLISESVVVVEQNVQRFQIGKLLNSLSQLLHSSVSDGVTPEIEAEILDSLVGEQKVHEILHVGVGNVVIREI